MLYQISAPELARLKPLCEPLVYHLVLESILDGNSLGIVFTDHPTSPQTAWINFKHHCFLVGAPDLPAFIHALLSYFRQCFISKARTQGQDAFLFDSHPAAWNALLEHLIPGNLPRRYMRQYFACQSLQQDWRALIPKGFSLKQFDADLLAQTHLANLDAVRDEMCSERSSVEDFLARSFGFCIQHGDELVAWAFSEYNTAGRCEVGIATVEKYRCMGLGTVVALALVEHAIATGYHTIGWHCWANNTPSAALARGAGFEHRLDYPVELFLLPAQ